VLEGRILHHPRNERGRLEAAVLIVGYQSPGSLGRRLVDREKTVTIFGEKVAVRASVHTLGGFSAHAGQDDLVRPGEERLDGPFHVEADCEDSEARSWLQVAHTALVHPADDDRGSRLQLVTRAKDESKGLGERRTVGNHRRRCRELSAKSLEIRPVEFELEPPYSRVDLDLPAPGDSWQIAGRRAGRARHQVVLSRSEGKLDVGRRPKNGQGWCSRHIRVLVQIDDNRP
jgi:hypothetical protein